MDEKKKFLNADDLSNVTGGANWAPRYENVIGRDDCIGCGVCVDECPIKCITLEEVAKYNIDECIGCDVCREACPMV